MIHKILINKDLNLMKEEKILKSKVGEKEKVSLKSKFSRSVQKEKKQRFWKKNWVFAVTIFIVAIVLYGQCVTYEYVLDDVIVLSENSFVKRGLSGIFDIFTNDSFTGYFGEQKSLVAGARYRPLSLVSFALEYELYGLRPDWSHLINILLYGLTGLLAFRVSSQLIRYKKRPKWWLNLPFLAALVFIVHPVHTEVIANIKGRDEILTLIFSLSTLYFSFQYYRRSKFYFLILSGLAFFLGLLAKENTITFLAIIPLTIYLFTKAKLLKIAAISIPLVISTIIYLIIRYNVIGYLMDGDQLIVTGIMNNQFVDTSADVKYATTMYTLGLYLKLLLWPHPLTHDYYPYQIPNITWGDLRAILSLGFYLILAIITYRNFKKKSVVSWSILFFIITLSIVSNIFFSVGATMNERFIYMPSLGLQFFYPIYF